MNNKIKIFYAITMSLSLGGVFFGLHTCSTAIENSQERINHCKKACYPFDIDLSHVLTSGDCYCDKSKKLYKADEVEDDGDE